MRIFSHGATQVRATSSFCGAGDCANARERKPRLRALPTLAAAIAVATLLQPRDLAAQTVTAPPTVATCIENTSQMQFACGSGSNAASAFGALAVGELTSLLSTPGINSTAVGNTSSAQGNASVALGSNDTLVPGQFTSAIGNFSVAIGGGGVGAEGAQAAGQFSIAIGSNSAAGGLPGTNAFTNANTIAIGGNAQAGAAAAGQTNATAVGFGAQANGANSTAFGASNTVNGDNSGAFGTGQTVNGNGSFAIGDPNLINGNGTFVLGDGNTVNGGNTAGFGDNIQVVGSNNTIAATASAAGSSVFGSGNTVNSTNSFVFANNSTVSGASAIGIGNSVSVTGDNAVAIGNGTSANFANSAAIGNGATVTRANQQVFGTATNTYTMPGIGSAASKAAQSGPTQIVTADAAGNLATTTLGALGIASTADVNAINSQLASLQTQINTNLREARAGTALALAATGLHYDPRPGKFSVAVSYGNFKGLSGLAAGLGYAVTDRVRVNGAFTASPDQNDYGGVVGASLTLN